MLESCIRESKPRPDYSQTDEHQVGVLLRGSIRNPLFVRFLERVGEETLRTFSTRDFMVLDLADQGDKLPPDLSSSAQRLREMGVVESVGRGRGTRYVLSRRYYQFAAAAGTYTRMRGLDRDTNKQLLLTHVVDSGSGGCPLAEIQQVLPSHSRRQLQGLMSELRRDGLVEVRGKGRGARWFATA